MAAAVLLTSCSSGTTQPAAETVEAASAGDCRLPDNPTQADVDRKLRESLGGGPDYFVCEVKANVPDVAQNQIEATDEEIRAFGLAACTHYDRGGTTSQFQALYFGKLKYPLETHWAGMAVRTICPQHMNSPALAR